MRRIGVAVASLLATVGIAACGGGGSSKTGSGADPAGMVPASAVFYASATIQPGSSQVQALEHVVNRLGGSGTWNRFLAQLDHSLSSGQVSYDKDFKPWIGGRVGLALTKWPANLATSLGGGLIPSLGGGSVSNLGGPVIRLPTTASSASAGNNTDDVLLVFPTDHPDKARQALPTLEQGASASGVTGKVVGHYVLFGGQAAVSAAQSVSPRNSLASSSAYRATASRARANALASFYLNLHSFVQVIRSAANSGSANPGSFNLQPSPGLLRALSSIPANASAMASVSVTNQAITFDVTYHGFKSQASAGSATVGSLPGDSWLAVALHGISTHSITQVFSELGQIEASSAGQISPSQIQGVRRFGRVIEGMFPDGIGQISLSIAGASQTTKAGLSVDAKGTQTAQHAVSTLYSLITAGGGNVSGSPSAFSMPASNFSLRVGSTGSDVVATLGYPSSSAFASPASKLSGDATYQTAVGQLAAGSSVPLYLNFDKLLAVVPTASQQTRSTLQKLSYLIVGSSDGDFRVVLGLH